MRYRRPVLILLLVGCQAAPAETGSAPIGPFPVDTLDRLPTSAFEEVVPANPQAWLERRDEIRRTLWELMGPVPDVHEVPAWSEVAILREEDRTTGLGNRYRLQEFYFVDGYGLHVRGYLLLPQEALDAGARVPAILYNHFHGDAHEIPLGADELFRGGWNFGHRLINEGWAVLAIDAPGHGKRLDPAYRSGSFPVEAERTRDYVNQLYGMNLMSVRTYDDMLALQMLAAHPNVRADRIATMGMSMGSPRSYYLAAMMGEKLRAAVGLATIPRYQDSIVQGMIPANANLHVFPGQLRDRIDTEAVVASIAPLPFKLYMGELDEASPGDETVFRVTRDAYRVLGAESEFSGVVMEETGHDWPDFAIADVLQWLRARLA